MATPRMFYQDIVVKSTTVDILGYDTPGKHKEVNLSQSTTVDIYGYDTPFTVPVRGEFNLQQ